jgi:hypothetical protein
MHTMSTIQTRPANNGRMHIAIFSIVFALWAGITMSASNPSPFLTQFLVIDQLFAATQVTTTRALAVQTLEAIAAGTPLDQFFAAHPGDAQRLNLTQTDKNQMFPYLLVPTVRAYALGRLGETGLADVESFLENLGPTELENDRTGQVRPAARIAYWDCRVRRLGKGDQAANVLEAVLFEQRDARSDGAVRSWAANELCSRGARESLPLIRQSIKSRNSLKDGDDEIRFCEVRIDILTRFATRQDALTAALRMVDDFQDFRIKRWAIEGLLKLRSPQADAALLQYANELRNSAPGTTSNHPVGFREDILERLRQPRAER